MEGWKDQGLKESEQKVPEVETSGEIRLLCRTVIIIMQQHHYHYHHRNYHHHRQVDANFIIAILRPQ